MQVFVECRKHRWLDNLRLHSCRLRLLGLRSSRIILLKLKCAKFNSRVKCVRRTFENCKRNLRTATSFTCTMNLYPCSLLCFCTGSMLKKRAAKCELDYLSHIFIMWWSSSKLESKFDNATSGGNGGIWSLNSKPLHVRIMNRRDASLKLVSIRDIEHFTFVIVRPGPWWMCEYFPL